MALNKPPVGTKVRNVFEENVYGLNLGNVGTVVESPLSKLGGRVDSLWLDVHFEEWTDLDGSVLKDIVVLFEDDSEFEIVE